MNTREVLALNTGTVFAETKKAINLNGEWIPRSAISEVRHNDEDFVVVVFKAWWIKNHQYLIKTQQGLTITRWTELKDGTILYQGDLTRVKLNGQLPPLMTHDEMDELMDNLEAQGMDWKEAVKIVRKRARGEQ